MEQNKRAPGGERKKTAAPRPLPLKPAQGTSPGDPFPIGVYPVFDDDLPRDSYYGNFSAPDLRDEHPYPRGLE